MSATTRVGWRDLYARRAQVEVGGEIARIMALSGRTDVISFAGGFPDPAAIDRDGLAEIMGELASGDVSAFEYAPTGGLPGLRSYLVERIGAHEGRLRRRPSCSSRAAASRRCGFSPWCSSTRPIPS